MIIITGDEFFNISDPIPMTDDQERLIQTVISRLLSVRTIGIIFLFFILLEIPEKLS
jgi:hypothetical protein